VEDRDAETLEGDRRAGQWVATHQDRLLSRREAGEVQERLDRHRVPFYDYSFKVGQIEFSDDMASAESIRWRAGTRVEDLERRQTANLRRKYGPQHLFESSKR
jgi:hypothetical protein